MTQLFLKAATVLLAISSFCSCGEDAEKEDSLNLGKDKMLESISITASDFQTETGTRSSFVINNDCVKSLWEEGDVVGIFHSTGDQVSFAMDDGAGRQTATFNGGGWALKASSTYAAYYPYDFYNRDLTSIPVSYGGQVQIGNNTTDHLGAYDFMAANVTTPSHGAVSFDMKHMGALVMLQVNLGEAKTLTNLALKANTSAFTIKGAIDLTAVNPKITAKSTTSTLNIALNDFTVAANETSTFYFMLAPTNLEGETLEITLSNESGAYIKYEVAGKNFVAGTAYAYSLSNKKDIYNAVDLGLPSGTLWADRNVGADAPEAYGDYFAWGETEPKDDYYWDSYKWCNGLSSTLTKYCTNSSYGTVDNKTFLDLEDDAAYVNMGSTWRMPTYAEMQELMNNCTTTWTTQNGVNGRKVIGPNGNCIFLPAAGYRNCSDLRFAGSFGIYWSSSLNESDPNDAYYLYFSSDYYNWYHINRSYGRTVRAVLR